MEGRLSMPLAGQVVAFEELILAFRERDPKPNPKP